MSINDYASKIKTITNSLGSIGVTVDDDDVVATTLEGLGTEYKNFKSYMNTRVDVPNFTKLTTMLIREQKSLGLGASSSQNNISYDQQAFYSNRDRDRGRGTGGGRGGQYQNWQENQSQGHGKGRQNYRGKGRIGNHKGNRDQNNASDVECWTRGASNHMTSHGEWFKEMKQLDGPSYVKTGDDLAHSIVHVGKVPLQMMYLADVLHVPNITKNLVSVGQMIEQRLQFRFNPDDCYVEDYNNDCHGVADYALKVTSQSVPQVSHKGKEKEGELPCMTSVSSGSSHVDADSDSSDQSLNEEFDIPTLTTLSVRKQAARTFGNDSGPRRSNKVRFSMDMLTYDGYITHHYAYMANVVQDVKPTCFEKTIGNEN
ncbi:hypothetical protein L7F22_058502 [Adiantum nelumboides]|nr:hypothetical protein [Adiantum nelumboides]